MNDSITSLVINPNGIILTIIVPVRNECRYIIYTLEQLYSQSLDNKHYEIIVADGMSEDGTKGLVIDFSVRHQDLKITVVENMKQLSSAGRNLAIKNGSGEYFLLIDGHVHIDDPKLLENYLELAIKNKALCLGRPQPLNPPDITLFQKYVSIARQSFLAHSPDSHIYKAYEGWVSPLSIGVMYHKSLFEKVGYFDENFDAAEDLEFNYRLEMVGIQCYSSSKLAVSYYPRENFNALFRQLTRYGYGRALLQNKHELTSYSSIVPSLFFSVTILLLILSPFSRIIFMLSLSILLIYILMLLVEGFRMANLHGQKNPIFIGTIISIIHGGIAFGYLKGLCLIKLSR